MMVKSGKNEEDHMKVRRNLKKWIARFLVTKKVFSNLVTNQICEMRTGVGKSLYEVFSQRESSFLARTDNET